MQLSAASASGVVAASASLIAATDAAANCFAAAAACPIWVQPDRENRGAKVMERVVVIGDLGLSFIGGKESYFFWFFSWPKMSSATARKGRSHWGEGGLYC